MKLTALLFFLIALFLGLVSAQQLATDAELSTLSEALYAADNSNVNTFVTIDYGTSTPLLQINEKLYGNPTVSKLRALFNHNLLDSSVNEFLDAVMATRVMTLAMQFLQQKGIATPGTANQKQMLKSIWFTKPQTGGRQPISSGFEHVFLAETDGQTVKGLHNWIYFAEEERKGNAAFKGLRRKLVISPPSKVLIKIGFEFHNIGKPASGMFVGTPPELELALYTVCFYMRARSDCPVTLDGQTFIIKTFPFLYRGKNLVRTAFPAL